MYLLAVEQGASDEEDAGFYYGVDTKMPANRDLQGRLFGALVGCSTVSVTVVYVAPFLAWLSGVEEYGNALKGMSDAVTKSLVTPEGDYISMVLGLLAVSAALFIITTNGAGLHRRGEVAEFESIASFVSILNVVLAMLFLVLTLYIANAIILNNDHSFKALIISAVGFVLCLALTVLRGSSAASRISAIEFNKRSQEALARCWGSIPGDEAASIRQLYIPPLIFSLLILLVHIVVLSTNSLFGVEGLASSLGAACYISLAIELEVYRRVCLWNQTKLQRISNRIIRVQVWGLILTAFVLPVALLYSALPSIGGIGGTVTALVAGVTLLASVAVPLVYIDRSRRVRDLIRARQKAIIAERIKSVDHWIMRQEEWLAS